MPVLRITEDDFIKGVSLVRFGIEQGYIRIRFGGVTEAPFLETIHKQSLEEAQSQFSISNEIAKDVMNELPEMLRAILTNTQAIYISRDTQIFHNEPSAKQADESDKGKKKANVQLVERFSIVRRELINPRISERFLLRKTAANALLRQCSGGINRQIYSTENGDQGGLYVQVSLFTTHNNSSDEKTAFFSMFGLPFGENIPAEQFTLTCDESDLDALIDVLSNLRDRLREQLSVERPNNDPI